MRVLFLAANPSSNPHLALDEELRAIQMRLRQSGAAERIELCAEWALRREELPAALMRHRPQVVHFSGHGSAAGELYLSSDELGETSPVAAETLRRIFEPLTGDISCVVLNACYSAVQAAALVQILPCVIGMTKAVKDTAAIAFAAGFYETLAFGESIPAAFKLGCVQIELAQGPGQHEIPKMLVRPGTDATKLYPLTTMASAPATGHGATGKNPMKIHIGGNASGVNIIQGDHNVTNTGPVITQTGSGSLQAGGSNTSGFPVRVDIRQELAKLREALSPLKSEHRRKIDNALEEAEAEAAGPHPDHEEVSKSLTRALEYAKKAQGFAQVAAESKPHLMKVVAWLGSEYQHVAELMDG